MHEQGVVSLLRDPATIRQRARQLFERALRGESLHFAIDESKIIPCCDTVLSLVDEKKPLTAIPFHSRWRHFSVGDIDRVGRLARHASFPESSLEQGRLWYEMVILSVLLDAGAGSQWSYTEPGTACVWKRSEGLALASMDMFLAGFFSSSSKSPWQADWAGLKAIDAKKLAAGLQASEHNPLLGLSGRATLINALADVLTDNPQIFREGRLGMLYDYILEHAVIGKNSIDAPGILDIVLTVFSKIWPGRILIDGENLGDVWRHPAVVGEGKSNGFIPFHKLSQWLTYSLLEPLQWQGYALCGLEKMTGLAEYRNGGLLIDSGVIVVKDPNLREMPLPPGSEAVVEWRALTVCLLDRLWFQALKSTQLAPAAFPLIAFLEAGTWKAGRLLARQRDPDANPPLVLLSDGTVF